MSYPMTRLGGQALRWHLADEIFGAAFNHSSSRDAEAEYDRLRDLARQEAAKRGACFDKSHQAYERGDGAAAKQFSNEGKAHAARMDQYNKQASDFIFRENNAPGRVADDTIDLHGQFVEEAEDILEQRIRYAQQTGQTHLHVIVGKGNHSVDHIQKIKPRVERVCHELRLQYATEDNAGRMYINLQGGPAVMPDYSNGHHGPAHPQGQLHHGGYQGGYQPQQPQQAWAGQGQPQYGQHPHQQQQQQNNGNDEVEQIVKKVLPRVIRKLEGCCAVM
ncbi:MAG: hypothetical protein M1818_004147 [Claussenomyces sp. TS43310]|nr:MAG: hypothetical protein M1818_004147 [Claussenomyces sp. TS43310]